MPNQGCPYAHDGSCKKIDESCYTPAYVNCPKITGRVDFQDYLSSLQKRLKQRQGCDSDGLESVAGRMR